jgi:hypothetical protein
MKFQGIVTPKGLMVHLEGPFTAPRNNSGVLNTSTLLTNMEQYAIQPGSREGDPPERWYFQVYGDLAYGVSPLMVSPYSGIGECMRKQAA